MKEISNDYLAEMNRSFRRPSSMRITIRSGDTVYTFGDDMITSARRIQDVDPLSRRLPTESFEFTVVDLSGEYNPTNPTGKWDAIDKNAEIEVEFGFYVERFGHIEWLSPDYYILDGRPAFSGVTAAFKAISKLRHMTRKYYKGTTGTHTLKELAIDVLTDASIPASEYDLDDSLAGISTDAPLPINTGANLLQLIAHAAGCALFTRSGMITIKPINTDQMHESTSGARSLTMRDIAAGGDTISKIEPLYKVQGYKYTYTAAEASNVVFEALVDVYDDTPYHCEFDAATDLSVSISAGATISGLTTYARAADMTITGRGTFTVTITGKKISQTSDIADAVVNQNTAGGVDTENNPLVTSDSLRHSILYSVANYLALRVTHTMTYRGSPEIDATDGIYFATLYETFAAGLVLSSTIDYNGAISGNLIIKSIAEADTDKALLYDSEQFQIQDSAGQDLLVVGLTEYYSAYTATDMNQFCISVLGE